MFLYRLKDKDCLNFSVFLNLKFLISRLLFKVALDSQQNSRGDTESSHLRPITKHTQHPSYQYLPQDGTFIIIDDPELIQFFLLKPMAYSRVQFWCFYILRYSGKCIVPCTHQYYVIQSSFTALNILCAWLIHSSPSLTSGNH
jgi:hypothetical protein